MNEVKDLATKLRIDFSIALRMTQTLSGYGKRLVIQNVINNAAY